MISGLSFYLPEIGPGRLDFVWIGLAASEASGSWIGVCGLGNMVWMRAKRARNFGWIGEIYKI